jgi:hypothetical protein
MGKRANNFKDLSGKMFGKLLVTEQFHTTNGRTFWSCLCVCGKSVNREAYGLQKENKNGNPKSCGCTIPRKHNQHELVLTPTYRTWSSMKMRCRHHKRYLKNGISYDPQWEQFKCFLADMGERPKGTSLDRIDNKKGYSKENCRWATPKEQARNTSANVLYEHLGEKKTLGEWAEHFGVHSKTLWARIKIQKKTFAEAIK